MDKITIDGVELEISEVDFSSLDLSENIHESKQLPNFDIGDRELNTTMTPPGNNWAMFRKWFNGPRKTKKKNFGLAKDKRRINRKIYQNRLITEKELNRIKIGIKFS